MIWVSVIFAIFGGIRHVQLRRLPRTSGRVFAQLGYVLPLFVAAYYAGLIALTWYLRQPKEQRPVMVKKLVTPRRANLIGSWTATLLDVALSWRADNRLHVYVLEADGHPALVQMPSGKQILI